MSETDGIKYDKSFSRFGFINSLEQLDIFFVAQKNS